MAVAELGWASLVEAESYFANERLKKEHWTALADNDTKNMALNMAYNRIHYCSDYSTPAAGAETAAQLIILIKAQSEMAYYIALHLEDEDRRKGLQAQAVIAAGIVKETYDKDKLSDIPIPPVIDALLEDFSAKKAMAIIDIDRDEDESVDTKVDEF